MDNETYFKKLDDKIDTLKKLRSSLITMAAKIIGKTLFQEDLFFSSAIDRSIALLDGITEMLKKRNLTCAAIFVRSQIDNCMRIFAAFIAENREDFIKEVLNGTPIKDLRDDSGKKMRDAQLKKRLSLYDKNIEEIYKMSSGFVHLSDTAFHMCTKTSSDKLGIELSVGLPLKEDANEELLGCADIFIHYVELQNNLLQKVADSKERLESLIN